MANLHGATTGNISDTSSETIGGSQHSSSTLNNSASITPISLRNAQEDTRSRRNPSDKRPRKGHTKSRKGCLNCKRARIKVSTSTITYEHLHQYVDQCKENRPSCDYCVHRNLQCQWPEINHLQPPAVENQIDSRMQFANSLVQTPIAPEIQVVGPVYNAFDFKLFHHFIDKAHPHHPIGSDAVWRHEIPIISSDVSCSCK
jgi:hypothetical protein